MGHQVLAVADGGELLAMVKDKPPDVLFIEPTLARLETVEPLRVMRLENRLVGVRIVLVDDKRVDGGAWAPLVRQLVDGVLESFRGGDIQKAIDAAIGMGKHNAATVAPPQPPPPRAPYLGAQAPPARGGFSAPRAPATPPPAPAAPPPTPSQPPPDPSRPTVVLVEDLPQLRALLGIKLEGEGWRVAWYATAEEALRAVEAEGCDAVLSDINLPGMSGDQFVELVRKRFPGVWCFLMTALPRERWPRVPPSIRIFAKPLDMNALSAALREVRQFRANANRG